MIVPRRLLLAVAAITVLTAACNTRRPARFLIPAGFKGWVKIDFQVSNTKPLPVEDGRWLFNLDSAGHLQTSSPLDGAWRWTISSTSQTAAGRLFRKPNPAATGAYGASL